MLNVARQLAKQLAARADEADRQGRLPTKDIDDLRNSGYLTMIIPSEYGGLGMSMRDIVATHLELSQGSTSTALVAAMPLQIFGYERELRMWSDEHFAEACTAVVTDGALFNVAASEPAMGSPSRGKFFQSTAVRHTNGWCVNGHKNWVTGGRHITHILIKLMVEDEAGVVLVKGDAEGVRWEATWQNALSLRASDSDDLYLNDVIIPENAVYELGKRSTPYPNVWFPILVGATYLGAAIAARNGVIQYTLERVPTALGKPIATLPKIQRQIGEIDIPLQAARALMLEVAAEWSHNTEPEQRAKLHPRITAAKHFAVESAIAATDIALKIAGGQGITHDLPLERHFRDVRAGSMQPPAGDTALEIVGSDAIGYIES